jgi:serine protease AprX
MEGFNMKKYFYFIFVVVIIASFLGIRQTAQASPFPGSSLNPPVLINPDVQSALSSMQPGDLMTVIVTLRQHADLSRVRGADHAARLQGVIRDLQATANATQGPLIGLLNSWRDQGLVQRFDSFWVFNGFSITATSEVINQLAQNPDVLSITPDDIQVVPTAGTPEPNLSVVNAPALWSLGYYGQGVVVANLDSGVDINHPDLSATWRGGANSWYDPYGQHPTTPADMSGHGTETMGLMVGQDAGGTSIGVAPQARWIAVKIFNDAGSATATAIHLGFQWLLDPDGNPATNDAPQVVNNSWAFGTPGCNLEFQLDLQALRAAEILPVFAGGNYGPNSATSVSPANYPEAFAVGATDNNNQIYPYSSRGPTTCGGSTGPYPEVVAPGVNVRTTGLFGAYTIDSGTSLAAPEVASGLALLLSAYPNLRAVDQERALISSALDLGATGPDDVYGYGRLDLLAAYNWLATAPTATPPPSATPTSTPTPTPTFTPTPQPATTLHVGDLDRSSLPAGSKWNATVTILVHDAHEKPVANATVSGKWSNGTSGTASCSTNTSGLCQVTKTGLNARTTSVTFSVTNVTQATLTYLASANHDPDGDSTGTSINVNRP